MYDGELLPDELAELLLLYVPLLEEDEDVDVPLLLGAVPLPLKVDGVLPDVALLL